MSRTTARETALKIIFELSFQNEELKKLFDEYVETEDSSIDLNKEDNEYIENVISGVQEKMVDIDEKIKAHLKDWNFDRISKIDLAILRLSIYEILYRDDIPYKVSINEAVELSKTYSEESSPSFINGVLAEIVKEIE